MGVIDDLLANNEAYSASLPERHLDVRPSRRLAIVTCMDARLDVFSALGLSYGEVHILRNAGGVITDDVIRSLAVSQRRLGTRGVMLIHHTNCGMQTLTDDGFRAELQEAKSASHLSPIRIMRPSTSSMTASIIGCEALRAESSRQVSIQ